jgi:hypothetical protein
VGGAGRFDKPVVTCFSDKDAVTHGGEKVFIERVPGAKGQPHTIVKGGGHFLQEDAPEELVRIILDHINEGVKPMQVKNEPRPGPRWRRPFSAMPIMARWSWSTC